ncbi:MAG: hypothetical protein ACP5OC_07455 [Thermoplasmata archaeon]
MNHSDVTLEFLRPYTVVDSIKTTGSIVSCYLTIQNSLGNSADVESLMNGAIRTTSLFPLFNSEKMFPLIRINFILKGIKAEARKNILDKRKRIARHVPWSVIKQISNNFIGNDYEGVNADIVLDHAKFEDAGPFRDSDRLSVNLSGPLPELYTREFEPFSPLSITSGEISGLKYWFSYSASESVEPEKLHASIRLLEDFGLSGRRSTGSGYYKIERMEGVEDRSQDFTGEGLYLLLSRYIPSSVDIDSLVLEKSLYSISTISGNDSSGRNMGTYRCFSEGSLLYLKGDVTGRSYITGNKRFLPFFPVLRRIT